MGKMLARLAFAATALSALFTLLIVGIGFACSGRGAELAFESDRDGNWEIYRLDLTTHIAYNLTRNPADDLNPAWSPDGSQIAFSADRDGDGQPELYVMDADGTHLRRVSTGSGGYRNPNWSHNGELLVYMLGFGQVYAMDADGSNERRLGNGFLPSLSTDGRWLLYSAESTSTIDADIYTTELSTLRTVDLTSNPANEWGARWSPDNALVAFSSLRGGRTRVYVMNADGSESHAVSDTGANDLSPAWSPDGSSIAFTADSGGRKQLYIVGVDGSNERRVTDHASNSQSPAWRP